jgi:hypothetical protein
MNCPYELKATTRRFQMPHVYSGGADGMMCRYHLPLRQKGTYRNAMYSPTSFTSYLPFELFTSALRDLYDLTAS